MKKVLFICSRNKWRSPTAEQVFSTWPGLEVDSAGLNADAEVPLAAEQVLWADVIFVMEKGHRSKLSRRFKTRLKGQKVICLDIADNYQFMDRELVELLLARVPRHLK